MSSDELIARYERFPDRPVRVIVTLRGDAAAARQTSVALRGQAGVVSAEVLDGLPMIVLEAKPAALRALFERGQVAQIQADTPVPPN
jgi:hypothetical protein